MSQFITSRRLQSIVCILIGVLIGYLAFNQRSEILRLKSELRSAIEVKGNEEEALRLERQLPREAQGNLGHQNTGLGTALTEEPSNEDKVAMEDLERRKLAGEYVLESENPFIRNTRFAAAAGFAAQFSSNNAAMYSRLFAELGVSPDESQCLQKHLEKIALAATETKSALMELHSARSAFKRNAQKVLGDENYEKYRTFEEARRAEGETKQFSDFLQQRGMSLTPEQQQHLVESIKESAAYTQKPNLGPFDPIPEPAVGPEMIANMLNNEISDLTQGSSTLLHRLSAKGWSQEEWQPVYDYYSKIIAERNAMLSNVIRIAKDGARSERVDKFRARAQER